MGKIVRTCRRCGAHLDGDPPGRLCPRHAAEQHDRDQARADNAARAAEERPLGNTRGRVLRGCSRCGKSFDPKTSRWPHRYCPRHELVDGERSPSTYAARDAEYQRHRARILAGNPRCVDCGEPADVADHIVPVSRGGTNDPDNLQPMCSPCNLRKGARLRNGTAPAATTPHPPAPTPARRRLR